MTPEGWAICVSKEGRENPYAIQRDGFTICRIGNLYELWKGKEQLVVNLPNAQAAIDEFERRRETKAA